MSAGADPLPASVDVARVTVRYWAAARDAAGVEADDVAVQGSVSLGWLLDEVRRQHPGPRFAAVLDACSVLVDDRPAGVRAPEQVLVTPGARVELLPPFAGG